MEALIAALSPRPMSRRRQLAIAAALGVIVTGASAYAFLPGRSAATPGPRCDLGAQRLAGVWDQARKSQLREAFQQSGARGADLTWKSFSAIVDERAGAWAAMHDQACAATHVEGAQSPAVLDLRMECLERKRQEMKTLVDVYAEKPDAAALDRAVAAADKLSSISPCADVTNLRAVVPLPDDAPTRAKVQELRQSLGQSRALEQAGRYQQGRDYMVSLKREADAVGYAPVAAEAANALAAHLSLAGKTAEAEKVLFEAAAKAVEGRDWTLEAEIWLALLANYARAGRIEDGLLSARVAELAVERANGDNAMRALLANNIADAVANSGNLVDALRRYQQAEDLWRKSLNVGSPQYASLLRDLGDVLNGLGRIRQGLDCVERALAIQRAMLRADHPDIADSVQAVGVTHVILGRFQTGREMVQSALEILLRELGPEHVLTMHALQVTAYIESYFGNSDRALELFSRLLATQHRKLNPADPLLAITYFGMGEAQRLAGRSDEAEGSFERVIELNARGGIPEHLGTGYALTSLGRIHNGRGDDTRALRECRHGLDILTRSLGQGSSRLIDSQECIGEALMARGDFAAARHELEHALTTIAEGDLGPQYTAGARFQLTRALWHTPEDRPRALELARTTLSELTAAEGDNRKMIARIKAWLSAHD